MTISYPIRSIPKTSQAIRPIELGRKIQQGFLKFELSKDLKCAVLKVAKPSSSSSLTALDAKQLSIHCGLRSLRPRGIAPPWGSMSLRILVRLRLVFFDRKPCACSLLASRLMWWQAGMLTTSDPGAAYLDTLLFFVRKNAHWVAYLPVAFLLKLLGRPPGAT